MPAAPIIAYDLPCRRCRYNLRPQPTDGRCPECGTRVEVTLGERPPPPAPLVDTPTHRRLVALGCFGVAASLPAFLVAQWIVQAYFHSAGIFWKIDPPYLLGPVALLFAVSVALTCVPRRRIDGTAAHRPLLVTTLIGATAAPLAAATWEYGYAYAPFHHYDFYVRLAECLSIGAHAALSCCCLRLAAIAREWKAEDLPRPLMWTGVAWGVTLLQAFGYRDVWRQNVTRILPTRVLDALGRHEGPVNDAFAVACAATAILLFTVGIALRRSTRPRPTPPDTGADGHRVAQALRELAE